jgi:hypothetical protein
MSSKTYKLSHLIPLFLVLSFATMTPMAMSHPKAIVHTHHAMEQRTHSARTAVNAILPRQLLNEKLSSYVNRVSRPHICDYAIAVVLTLMQKTEAQVASVERTGDGFLGKDVEGNVIIEWKQVKRSGDWSYTIRSTSCKLL